FRVEGEQVLSDFVPRGEHQGFSGLLHGGIMAAALDDTMVRAVWRLAGPSVTVRMEVEYRRAARIGEPLRLEGELGTRRGRLVEAVARARRADGGVVAQARGRFMLVDADRLAALGGA